jgi:hypothetical protein
MGHNPRAHPARSSSAVGEERRVWVRHVCDLPSSCQPVIGGGDKIWSARVQNISRGGVNILVNRRFEPGTILQIDLQNGRAKLDRSILARVIHVTQQKSGLWSTGCAFPWELSEEDLHALLSVSDR